MSKPGVSKAWRDADLADCNERAQRASNNQYVRAPDRAQTHNRVLINCMRAKGYDTMETRSGRAEQAPASGRDYGRD